MRALAIIAVLLLAATARAAGPQDVARQQAQARERMQEVERRLLELADVLEPQDRAHAEALRRALTLSRQQFVVANMAQAESQLQGGNYGAAAQSEQQVLAALQQLGGILSEATGELSVDALRAAGARLAELERRQADAVKSTQQLSDSAEVLRAAAETQHAIAADLKALVDDLHGARPSDDLKAALSAMSDAEAALSGGRKADGLAAQTAAQKRLETARQQLQDAIAGRLRAEQAHARAELIKALQRMLDEQRAIRSGTVDLGKEAAAGPTGRAYRLRAQALSGREKALQKDAGAVLDAVVKDGTTVALPAALKQVGDDVAECARLLGQARAGPEVTALQEGIESALAALIDAFQAAQKTQTQEPRTPAEQQAQGKGPSPLVDPGQQLKVLRAMQLNLNAQTEGPGADAARLAQRQGALAAVARALEAGAAAGGMEDAQALLAQGETGEPVRSVQRDVVKRLDALIARYEAQRQVSVPGEPKQAKEADTRGGAQAPVRAAEESTLRPGDWRQGRLPEAARLPGDWVASLPPSEQKKIADTFSTGRLPARYVELLREYNKRLAQP